MSVPIYAWDADPVRDRRLYGLSVRRADELVASGCGQNIVLDSGGRRAVRKFPPTEVLAEHNARSQVFAHAKGRPMGALIRPARLHYPVPACADRRRRCLARFMTPEKIAETTP
jgi:hypothetical protein